VTMIPIKRAAMVWTMHLTLYRQALVSHYLPFAAIVRTRDSSVFPKATAVVDVGGVYDPASKRYDHHQRTFAETFPLPESMKRKGAIPVKMSSAGLVYLHHGKEAIRQMLGLGLAAASVPPVADGAPAAAAGGDGTEASFVYSESDVDLIFDRVYGSLIREVDAIDNGVDALFLGPRAKEEAEAVPDDAPASASTHLAYSVTSGLAARVGRFNPGWQEDSGPELENRRFAQGMESALSEFFDQVRGLAAEWLPARSIVEAAFRSRETDCPGCGGQVLKLARRAPWKAHLFDIEEEAMAEGGAEDAAGAGPKPLYALYPDTSGGWRIQCVPEARSGFASRKLLPAAWRGQRDEDLAKLIGIEGAVFCHAAGFIGGNRTFEGALSMAKAAVSESS